MCLLHGDGADCYGKVCLFGYVGIQHSGIVHLVDMVAGEYEHILGIISVDEGYVLIDGIGCTGIPPACLAGLIRRQNENAAAVSVQIPCLTGAYVGVQLQRFILGKHANGIDIRIDAIGQRKIDDPVLTAKGYGGLCHAVCKYAETAALAASQQHGYYFLSDHKLPPCQ